MTFHGEGKPQYCSEEQPSRLRDASLCLWGGGLLQVWTAQQIKGNTTQQKSTMETSVPDDMNFHNLVLRNSTYNRER